MINIDFNPMKILLYSKQMEQMRRGEIPSPVMIEIDPVNYCNFGCPWCTSSYLLSRVKGRRRITPERFQHILNFIDHIGTVEGIYWCGGGEPTLNPHLGHFMEQAAERGIRNYITTNGSTLRVHYKYLINLCDWVAVSVNSGTEEMWKNTMHPRLGWQRFLDGLKRIADYRKQIGKEMELNYKHSFDPVTQADIFRAYELAVSLGFTHYTVKPVDMFNYDRGTKRKSFFSVWDPGVIENVNKQINAVQAVNDAMRRINLQSGGFYGMFDVDKEKFLHFDKCYAGQMAPVFGADGHIYLCCVRRGERSLGRWDDGNLIKYWGSEEHKHKALDFDPKKECPIRCKMGRYNEIFQTIHLDKQYSRGHI